MWILIRIWNTDPDQKAPEYGSNTDPDPQQCMLPLISLHLFPFSIILFCCDIRVTDAVYQIGMEETTDRVATMVREGLSKAGIDQSTQLAGIGG